MIHLSIQDIALLANLADCCNSVDEFVEYLNKTHAWGTTPLSARQDHDGEFVINYGTISDSTMDRSQDQRVGNVVGVQTATQDQSKLVINAVNTIKQAKLTGNPTYLFNQYSTIGKISPIPPSGDYLMLMYAGIHKLKHSTSEDYRTCSVSTLLKILYSRPEPLTATYNTVTDIKTGRDSNGPSEFGKSVQTIDTATHHRSPAPAVSVTTIDDTTLLKSIDSGYSLQTVYRLTHKRDEKSDEGAHLTSSVETIHVLVHKQINDSEHPVGLTSSYNTPGRIEHTWSSQSDAPIDNSASYNTPKIIQHIRWNPSEHIIGSTVTSISPGRIEHTRKDESDAPIDRGISTVTVGNLEHTRKDESDAPIDRGVSSITPGRIEHTRKDESDAPIDRGVSSITPGRIEHTRKDESDAPIDRGVSSITSGRIEHTRKDESDAPVDRGVSSITPGRIEHTRKDESDAPIDRGASIINLNNISYAQSLPERYYYANSIVHQTITEYKYNRIITCKTAWHHTLDGVDFYNVDKSVCIQTFDKFKNSKLDGDSKMLWLHTLDRVLYERFMQVNSYESLSYVCYAVPGLDTRVANIMSVSKILNQVVPGDTKVSTSQSVENIKHIKAEDVYTLHTVDSIDQKPPDNHIMYTTVTNISHKPCTDVRCDSQVKLWDDECLDTTYDVDGLSRATYGVTQIRVVLYHNDMEELYKPPSRRLIRVSDIRLKYRNNQVYNLSSHSVTAANCGGCFMTETVNGFKQVFTNKLQTTTHQLTSGIDAGVVVGSYVAICFTLTGCEPITHVEIAPGGDDHEPKNTPGVVRVDCMSPGATGWYNVMLYRTERKAIYGENKHNQSTNMWKSGMYWSFPLLNNDQLYHINTASHGKICT